MRVEGEQQLEMKIVIPVLLNNGGLYGLRGSMLTAGPSAKDPTMNHRVTGLECEFLTLEDYKVKYPYYNYDVQNCTDDEVIVALISYESSAKIKVSSIYTPSKKVIIDIRSQRLDASDTESQGQLPKLELRSNVVTLSHLQRTEDLTIEFLKSSIRSLSISCDIGAERWCDIASIEELHLPDSTGTRALYNHIIGDQLGLMYTNVLNTLCTAVGKDAFKSLRQVTGCYVCVKLFFDTFDVTKLDRLIINDDETVDEVEAYIDCKGRARKYGCTKEVIDLPHLDVDELYSKNKYTINLARCGKNILCQTPTNKLRNEVETESDHSTEIRGERIHRPHNLTHIRNMEVLTLCGSTYHRPSGPLRRAESYYRKSSEGYQLRLELDRVSNKSAATVI